MEKETAQDFIESLTSTSVTEIEEYASEITSNREFHNRLEENLRNRGSWSPSIGTRLGTVLYVLCRKLKPYTVVETGVAGGMSSSYILCALEENKYGRLYSIDLPWEGPLAYSRRYFASERPGRSLLRETVSGWLIPDYLRQRWQLILGRSAEELPVLLKKLVTIDMFLHDSEHSYRNMLFEYRTAWAHLNRGGVLLSHNIDISDAFSDFCETVRAKAFMLANMGGVVKP